MYDIIILGAGPAGLGCALHCAQRGMKTICLERDTLGTTVHTWLTFNETIEEYGLHETVRRRFKNIIFSSYLGNSFTFKSSFLVPIEETAALLHIAQSARTAGADIHDHEEFINYREENDYIIINTTKSTYHGRIVIDAMGRNSSLFPSRGLYNPITDMGCLAWYLKNANGYDPETCLLYDSFFPGKDYFWVVPFEDDKCMVGLFFFDSLHDSNMQEKTQTLERYMQVRGITGEIEEKRLGNIPLGSQDHIISGRFIAHGDTANTPLPSSGFGFNRCLEESKYLAFFLEKYFDTTLDGPPLKLYKQELLAKKIPAIETHLIISDMLKHFTDHMLNKGIAALSTVEEKFIIDFLAGTDMSIRWVTIALYTIMTTFSLKEISTMSLKQHTFRNLKDIYNLVPALPKANLFGQFFSMIKDYMHKQMEG